MKKKNDLSRLAMVMTIMVITIICSAQKQTPIIIDNYGSPKLPNLERFVFNPSTVNRMDYKAFSDKLNSFEDKAFANQPTYQLELELDFNYQSQRVRGIYLFNLLDKISLITKQDTYDSLPGPFALTAPKGLYEILVIFDEVETTPDGFLSVLFSRYVIREQVAIDNDLTMSIASNEAKNNIHFQTLTANGDPVYTGKYTVTEDGNLAMLEQGNTDEVYYFTMVNCKDYGTVLLSQGSFGVNIEFGDYISHSREIDADVLINDVSNRYSFYTYRCALVGHDVFTSSCEVVGATTDITLSNNPANFKLFEDPFVEPNHSGEETYQSFEFYARQIGDNSYNSGHIRFNSPMGGDETCKYYIGASPDDSEVGYVPFIIPQACIKDLNDDTEFISILEGKPITNVNEEVVIANNGDDCFTYVYSEELDELGWDTKPLPFWPTHPRFTYSTNKKKGDLGNNCPILITRPLQYEMTWNWDDENGNPVSWSDRGMDFYFGYIGRYGETKNDVADAHVSLKLDGDEIISTQGCFSTQLDELLNGVVEVSITNDIVKVDNMSGSNKASLYYIAGAEDENPPTMTMMHLRDTNDNVTDRFVNADEGILEFSAGDFNMMLTPLQLVAYDRQPPQSVEVYFSPYGEDNWNELTAEEVPESYWPTMGWFYTASLADVTGQGQDGWFDLRFRLEDAAGNWQEQVISPAFRIDDQAYSSVATVGGGNAREVARYNLAGQRVDASTPGVVIVKMSDGTARKVIQ